MTAHETAHNTKVQQLIDEEVAAGRHLGVQVCAYKDGEVVVDLGRQDGAG